MIFFSILCALVIDHFRPGRSEGFLSRVIGFVSGRFRVWCAAGPVHHVRMAWFMTVAFFAVPVWAVYWICLSLHPFFGLLWNILVLYLCMGFRHGQHFFLSIQMALLNGEEKKARRSLSQWCRCHTDDMTERDIIQVTIGKSLMAVLKEVFGVIFWFVLPFGPAGAVFYRVCACLSRDWNGQKNDENDFGTFADRVFYWTNWIPVRLTALSFAAVGHFEEAVYGWRHFSGVWKNRNVGVLLSSAGGAMGVQLGSPFERNSGNVAGKTFSVRVADSEVQGMPGEEPAVRFLQSTLGLIWRALLLWLILLFLFTIVFYLP